MGWGHYNGMGHGHNPAGGHGWGDHDDHDVGDGHGNRLTWGRGTHGLGQRRTLDHGYGLVTEGHDGLRSIVAPGGDLYTFSGYAGTDAQLELLEEITFQAHIDFQARLITTELRDPNTLLKVSTDQDSPTEQVLIETTKSLDKHANREDYCAVVSTSWTNNRDL